MRAAEGNTFAAGGLSALQALADEIAFAMSAAMLHQQERARVQQMTLLSQPALDLSGPQISIDMAADLIVRRAMKLLDADNAGLWLDVVWLLGTEGVNVAEGLLEHFGI